MASDDGPEGDGASLRAEIDSLRGELTRYRLEVTKLLERARAVIGGVEETKKVRYRLIGALEAHVDHVGAMHTELGAVTAIAARDRNAEAVRSSVGSVKRGLSIVGVGTAGLMAVGLLADIRTLSRDTADQVAVLVQQNQQVQVFCEDIEVGIEGGSLSFPAISSYEAEALQSWSASAERLADQLTRYVDEGAEPSIYPPLMDHVVEAKRLREQLKTIEDGIGGHFGGSEILMARAFHRIESAALRPGSRERYELHNDLRDASYELRDTIERVKEEPTFFPPDPNAE